MLIYKLLLAIVPASVFLAFLFAALGVFLFLIDFSKALSDVTPEGVLRTIRLVVSTAILFVFLVVLVVIQL